MLLNFFMCVRCSCRRDMFDSQKILSEYCILIMINYLCKFILEHQCQASKSAAHVYRSVCSRNDKSLLIIFIQGSDYQVDSITSALLLVVDSRQLGIISSCFQVFLHGDSITKNRGGKSTINYFYP